MAHFFDHDASDGFTVPVGRRSFEEVTLLFTTGEFRVSLIDNHVHQGVAHLLCWDLAEVLPLAAALVVAKLDIFGFDGAVESVELEAGDFTVIDADFFAPIVAHSHPLAESSDFGYFNRHKNLR